MFFIISLYISITHYRCWDTEKGEKNLIKLTTSVEVPQKCHQYNPFRRQASPLQGPARWALSCLSHSCHCHSEMRPHD